MREYLRSGLTLLRVQPSRCAASALLATGLGLLLPGLATQFAAAAGTVLPPVALIGTVRGVDSLQPGDLLVTIEPDPGWLDDLPAGTGFHESVVPSGLITTDGSTYAIHLDPVALPPHDITGNGLVTLEVAAAAPGAPSFGQGMTSVRAVVTADGSYAWTSPQSPAVLETSDQPVLTQASRSTLAFARASAFVPTRMFASRMKLVDLDVGSFQVDGSLAQAHVAALEALTSHRESVAAVDTAGDSGDSSVTVDDPVLDGASCGSDGAGRVPGTKKIVNVNIGQGIPIKPDRARMTFNDSSGHASDYTATLGVAYRDYGANAFYSQSNTKAVERTWGFAWDWKRYGRFFTVAHYYQKFTEWYDRCPDSPLGPYASTVEPRGFPGGVGESRNVPGLGYTKCQLIASTGIWRKDETSSRSWGSGKGVKISDWIGINLSSSKSYNDESALLFDMNTDHHWLCGQNYMPGRSGKIQERASDPNP